VLAATHGHFNLKVISILDNNNCPRLASGPGDGRSKYNILKQNLIRYSLKYRY